MEYIMNLDASAQVIKDLYARVGWNYAGWNKLLDADLVSQMGGNYNYDYVKELLRFIRNVISHYGEFPSEIQAIVSDGVEQYFALKFERLLMDVYTAISKNCKGNAKFRAYFLP
ncbi:unnamed protein product [Arabidopsis halleri]